MIKKHGFKYNTRILNQSDFVDLYKSERSDTLCERQKGLNGPGAGAYDGGKLIGLIAQPSKKLPISSLLNIMFSFLTIF